MTSLSNFLSWSPRGLEKKLKETTINSSALNKKNFTTWNPKTSWNNQPLIMNDNHFGSMKQNCT